MANQVYGRATAPSDDHVSSAESQGFKPRTRRSHGALHGGNKPYHGSALPTELRGRGGRKGSGAWRHLRPREPALVQARSGSGSSRGGGSSGRMGWPNSVQASFRHSQSWSGPPRASLAGWPQVGQRGGLSLMPWLYRAGAKQEPRHRGRTASIRRVWCYGDLDIGRVSLPPWWRERGNHWDRGLEYRGPRGESPSSTA